MCRVCLWGLTHLRSPHPRILSYSTVPPIAADQMTKSGSTITFGPYEHLPSVLGGKGRAEIAQAQVHYLHDAPVVSIVEVSAGAIGMRRVTLTPMKRRPSES